MHIVKACHGGMLAKFLKKGGKKMETSLYKSRKKYRTEANRKRRKMARATKAASAKKKRASRKMRRTRRARMQKARLWKRQANTGRSECFFLDGICPTMRIASLEDSYDDASEKAPTETNSTATQRSSSVWYSAKTGRIPVIISACAIIVIILLFYIIL